jgi:phosphatidylglycerol---prolipoprotein diacylglyceryl transferase
MSGRRLIAPPPQFGSWSTRWQRFRPEATAAFLRNQPSVVPSTSLGTAKRRRYPCFPVGVTGDTLGGTVPLAAIAFAFHPVLSFANISVRLETVGLAVAILLGLLLAGWLAVRTPLGDVAADPLDADARLRIDDLIFIVLAILPGSVLGGRLGYVLIHFDFYRANPVAIFDPGQGSLELSLAIVGGALTGAYATRLLGETVGLWLHVATLPLLVTITLGKVAQALAGSGQGRPTDVPWATSYQGSGPWSTLAPTVPSHPAQLYEAAATFVVLVLLSWLIGGRTFERRDGRAFLTALMLWLIARAAVATTWRDAQVAGPLNAEQLIAMFLVVACVGLIVVIAVRGRRQVVPEPEPSWPDPETRPQF